MRLFKVAILLSLILLITLSCDEKNTNPSNSELSWILIPIGGEMEYQWKVWMEKDTIIWSESGDYINRVESISDSVANGKGEIRLRSFNKNDSTKSKYTWYGQTRSGFTEFAYTGAAEIPVVYPKRVTAKLPLMKINDPISEPFIYSLIRSAYKTSSDTIQYRQDPRKVYIYPIRVGSSWTSFTLPFLQIREVVREEQVSVVGRNEQCFVIRSTSPEWGVEYYDTICWLGLIRRRIETTLIRVGENDPTPIDTVKYIEQLDLRSHNFAFTTR